MEIENVSGVVLAGGRSRRMGTKKADLKLGGRTLAEIQVQKLRNLGIDDVMISGYDGSVEGARTVADIYAGKGPLGGIHACLKAAEHPACLLISVDAPLVPEETLKALVEAHEGPATVLCLNGKIEPLMAVYDLAVAASAEEWIRNNDFAVRRIADTLRLKKLEYTGDPELLLNCNTPEEFEKAKSLWS